MTAPARRRRRVLPWVFAVVVALVAGWVWWAYAVVQHPRVDRPATVDAVLVLGGLPGGERTEKAYEMVQAGLTSTMVISTPSRIGDPLTRRLCNSPPAGVEVVCFVPDPLTTRGEARELGRLAAEHDWTRVAVVTSTYHVSRSRMIVGRCFGGTILVLSSGETVSAPKWAYEWLYQTAGFVKAAVLTGC